MDVFYSDDYHIPRVCKKCQGVMVYRGVGEYSCEDCGTMDMDDYGKVRCYIEQHPGTNAGQIECATGVSQRVIRQLLKDGRLEVASDSPSFLHCEKCGKSIRYGRFCSECEVSWHRMMEEKQRVNMKRKVQGVGKVQNNNDGKKRFIGEE